MYYVRTGGVWNQSKSITPGPGDDNPYNIDYDKLVENVKELNIIAGDGETKIEKTQSGARFKVCINFYFLFFMNLVCYSFS